MSLLIVIDRDYNNPYTLQNLILYGLDLKKNESRKILLEGDFVGFGVNPYNAEYIINSFNLTKRRFGKTEGKQIYHLVLSIYQKYDFGAEHKINISRDLIYDVGNYIEEIEGFQNVGFIHNCFGNVHIHFVINSVNSYTGNKLCYPNSFYYRILNFLHENNNNLRFNLTFNEEDLYG